VHTIRADAPMIEAAVILAEYRQLPVVDAQGRLTGLLTRTDVKNVIAEILASEP
jgi:CBS domain-containing protein